MHSTHTVFYILSQIITQHYYCIQILPRTFWQKEDHCNAQQSGFVWEKHKLSHVTCMIKYHIVVLASIFDKYLKIPGSCEQLPSHSQSLTPIIYILNGKPSKLPVHLTSFPPVAVIVLFVLRFFRYTFLSHVDAYKHPRCLSRIEAFHHKHFKRLVLPPSLSDYCWFPCIWREIQSSLAHTEAHQHHRASPQSSQDVQLLFCAPLTGKSIFVHIILAASLVYPLLKTEPFNVEQLMSLVAQSQTVWRVQDTVKD